MLRKYFGLRCALVLVFGTLLLCGCNSSFADFETYMQTPRPSNVSVLKMDGNWGNAPWRCWEISPADQVLARKLIAQWQMTPDTHAFPGVASEGKVYCRYDELSASYSANADSLGAVGIDAKRNVLIVYFYNG